jgi:succinate-acetate transporter protein
MLRPIGNPLPLGFLGLAGGTLLVSGLQLGWLDPAQGKDVALMLIAFVFPLQFLTSVLGYFGRDVVTGTGMGVLAGSWLSIALVLLTSAPGSTSDALGLLLLLSAAGLAIAAGVATGTKLVATAVLGTASVRFACTGLFELTASKTWEHIAGVVGLLLLALGLYAALAIALEEARRAPALPTGRRGAGLHLDDEPGVRPQL